MEKAEHWALMSVSEREEEGVILSIRIYGTHRTSDTGPNRLQTYIMAYLKHVQSYNGSGIVS